MATVRKIAWITGGGSGIGLAGAEALAAAREAGPRTAGAW